ncbi:MAG: methylmalonyl-CoA mutase [candidate division Zixibacteria bacterium]|nr:methylmalonyl-CoA mutase [candidate division Zixibacteria bacterium]
MSKKKEKRSISGQKIESLYSRDSLNNFDPEDKLGQPGKYPFTRGVYPDMYRSRFWTMRQYAGFGTASESNQRYRYLLDAGQTGLSVAFDLPTQIGYDSDHQMAEGEVGKTGVAIDSLADFEILFDQIPLDKVSTSMTINATATTLLAMYIAVAKKQGVAPEKITGTVQNDILKEYIARGTYIYPPAPSMRLIADLFEYAKDNLPRYNTISISGYHIREAGCTAIQEVAFTLANAVAYVEFALDRGLKIDDFAPRLSFFFNAHQDFFEEIAKFRAARRLWGRIVKERFKAQNEKSMKLRFHTQTAGSSLTAQQPENNVIRTTLEALAAVLGGTQSLHTNSQDEALGLPTEQTAQTALRIQQIIAHESGVTNTVDPIAGSYFVETLTNKIEDEAEKYIHKVDEMGGALKAVEKGFYQQEIQKSAYAYQKAVENEERIVVGVNKYSSEKELPQNILKVDPKLADSQIARTNKIKQERDSEKAGSMLKKLNEKASTDENLMPHILECVEAYCTVGEISDALRKAWGEYREQVIL